LSKPETEEEETPTSNSATTTLYRTGRQLGKW